MKTVKIILKFKFLTLFSDKIIQCYTESTVYTIITLFLYGIGAKHLVSLLSILHYLLHYSYMELEQAFQTILFFLWMSITLFLYGIGAILSPMTIELKVFNYIIPIWNWSFYNDS